MKGYIYQIVGSLLYYVLAYAIISIATKLNIPFVYIVLLGLTLISIGMYAAIVLLNAVLAILLPIKDKKINEKYTLHNDFTDMFNNDPKDKK